MSENTNTDLPRPKPPIGARPRNIATIQRIMELTEAIQRFTTEGRAPNPRWSEEITDLARWWQSNQSPPVTGDL